MIFDNGNTSEILSNTLCDMCRDRDLRKQKAMVGCQFGVWRALNSANSFQTEVLTVECSEAQSVFKKK